MIRLIARTRKCLAPVLALVLVALAWGCGATPATTGLDKVVFMAGFKPQANLPFVAAYVAKERGYFAEQGLDVEIRHAGSGEHLKLLMSADVDITTAAATSVLKRRADPELPIVAFALFGQRGQQAFVALKSSGIESPKQWEGKVFGYKISPPPDYLALLRAQNVDRDRITEVNAGFNPIVLTEGKVDILAVFKSNEPDTLRRLGFELNVWDPSDYGVPSMGLTYITRQELAEQKPDTVERFLKATLRGVEYSLQNKERALDIVMRYAPDEVREHQRFMLEVELDDAVSATTKEHGLGWMTDAQWEELYRQLLDFEALPGPFDHEGAYTDRFLKAVYDGGELPWP